MITEFTPLDPERSVKNLMMTTEGKRLVVLNLAWMWGHRCHYCGRPLNFDLLATMSSDFGQLPPDYPTVDHHVPKELGGTSLVKNLRLSCPPCNQRKGAHPTNHVTAIPWAPDAPSSICPMCEGSGDARSGDLCAWCDGRGEMTVEAATAKAGELLDAVRSLKTTQRKKQHEIDRLRGLIIGWWDDPNAWRDRARLLNTIARQSGTIRKMAEAFNPPEPDIGDDRMTDEPTEQWHAPSERNGVTA